MRKGTVVTRTAGRRRRSKHAPLKRSAHNLFFHRLKRTSRGAYRRQRDGSVPSLRSPWNLSLFALNRLGVVIRDLLISLNVLVRSSKLNLNINGLAQLRPKEA